MTNMKSKHHKNLRYSQQKQQRRQLHQCQTSINSSTRVSADTEIEMSDKDDKDLEQHSKLHEKFQTKCSVTTMKPSSRKSPCKKVDSKDEDNESSDIDVEKYSSLFQTVRERREQLVERLKIYNNLFKFHKTIKEDQVYLYRKLQDMDELYLRNTAAILRLGFCPCLVHQQTSPVGDSLMKIHRKLRGWDRKMEEIYNVLKEPSTRKTTAAVLQILKVCENIKFTKDQSCLNDIALPEVVWDLNNPYLEQINYTKLEEDWNAVKMETQESLCKARMNFQEICLEFGITRGPEQVPSAENETSQYTYDNVNVSIESEDVISNDLQNSKEEEEDEDGGGSSNSSIDTPTSKASSNF